MRGWGWSRCGLVVQNPVLLLLRVGNGAASGRLNGGESRMGRPTEVNERAGSGNGGPADASAAMDPNALAGAEAIGQAADEFPEGRNVRRNLGIGNRVREEIQANMVGNRAFVGKAKEQCLIPFEERNERLDSAPLHAEQFVLEPLIAAWPDHNGQRRGRSAFDPEDVVHVRSDSQELVDSVTADGDSGSAGFMEELRRRGSDNDSLQDYGEWGGNPAREIPAPSKTINVALARPE